MQPWSPFDFIADQVRYRPAVFNLFYILKVNTHWNYATCQITSISIIIQLSYFVSMSDNTQEKELFCHNLSTDLAAVPSVLLLSEWHVHCVLQGSNDTVPCDRAAVCHPNSFMWHILHPAPIMTLSTMFVFVLQSHLVMHTWPCLQHLPLQKEPTLSTFWRHTLHWRFFLKVFSLKMWGSPFPPYTYTNKSEIHS